MVIRSARICVGWNSSVRPFHTGTPAYSPSSSTMAPAVAAIFDAVIHAAQHAGGVFHRLFMANLRAAWAEIGDLRALGRTRPLRRRSGCGWRFFQRSGRCFSRPRVCFSRPAFFGGLELDGEVNQVLDLRRGVVQQFQEVAVFKVNGHG